MNHSSVIEYRVLFIEIARSRGCKDDSLEVTICLNTIYTTPILQKARKTRKLIIADAEVDLSRLLWWRQPRNLRKPPTLDGRPLPSHMPISWPKPGSQL